MPPPRLLTCHFISYLCFVDCADKNPGVWIRNRTLQVDDFVRQGDVIVRAAVLVIAAQQVLAQLIFGRCRHHSAWNQHCRHLAYRNTMKNKLIL